MLNTFIKAAEVWVPSDDGMLLEFGSGLFGDAKRFEAISRSMCFGRGEGLPGRAWDEARPILLPKFEGSFFRRTAAAKACGLSSALALPLFSGGKFTGVLVLFCGEDPERAATLELWRCSANGDVTAVGSLTPTDASGGNLQGGVALAALARTRGGAVFADELGAVAGKSAPRNGLAVPTGAAEDGYVVTLSGGKNLPVARRIERWSSAPGAAGSRCTCVFDGERGERVASDTESPLQATVEAGAKIVASAWSSGVAKIAESSPKSGTGVVAIPIVWNRETVEVVSLYL
jgi:GAF domain-containing protein